jgi:hypothetical protein
MLWAAAGARGSRRLGAAPGDAAADDRPGAQVRLEVPLRAPLRIALETMRSEEAETVPTTRRLLERWLLLDETPEPPDDRAW